MLRVLRRILGQQRDEVTGGSRKLRDEELHNFCTSSSIIKLNKPRTIIWTEHVAKTGGEEGCK
jgi:hypothetical protein